MNISSRLRRGGIVAPLVALASLALAGPVAANGVGDLYVASTSGVLEVHVATSTVVSTIPLVPSPTALAFSPDGRTLYASGGDNQIERIDIATLDVQGPFGLPGTVAGLAFPAGQVLVAAMPARRTLAFVAVPGGTVTESSQLPGPGNLIAGDRRDARIAVAEAGGAWLAIVDPATSTIKKATVSGQVRALAIERDRGGALVATTSPDALTRIDLTTMAVSWTVPLTATPAAVAPLASNVVVAAGTGLWLVDGKAATSFATPRQPVLGLAVSDEGAYVHAQEQTGIEVFDTNGALQRTLELSGDKSAVALAAVPRGSSLFLGHGPSSSGSPGPVTGGLTTPQPPPTSTIVDAAAQLAGSGPLQEAVMIGLTILVLCWLLIRWHDRRGTLRSR